MGILILGAALLTLIGLAGVIAVFAIPAWRPRGPQKKAAIGRLIAFAVAFVVGAGIMVYAAQFAASTITIID
ncbi:MAG: hypothetical protein QM602_07895 [Microbacterium sp.]